MPETMATMALDSLHEYETNNKKRREFEEAWQKLIPTPPRDAVWVYDFLTEDAHDKVKMMYELKNKGLGVRPFFQPLSTMPMWKQEVGKNALDYSKRGMYIQVNV